ncbi:MAG: hypothetical protein J1E62_11335 [Lachnospiraceae bacterium]|nr:hypothetical protein [Lachnospiraceae bacterium]
MANKAKATESKTNVVKNSPVAAVAKAVGAAKKPEVKPAVKAEEKKPAVKTEEKKPAVKKPAKKTAAKKAAKKPAEKVQKIFVEYSGEQFQTEEIVEKIHEVYKAEGHRVGAIKSLCVYIDPVERRAYYVINDKAEGKFVDF